MLWFLVSLLLQVTTVLANIPYEIPQFRSVLSQCSLQCPDTSAIVKNGRFENFELVGRFTAVEPGILVMRSGSPWGDRCELRHQRQWSTESTNSMPQTFKATVRLDPYNVDSFSIMQIHSKNFLKFVKGPPLMLKWRRSKSGLDDHLWAQIRGNLEENTKQAEHIHLGPRPDGFFDIEVQVQDMILRIWINGALKVTYNWDYLTLPQNYFKTGPYINSGNGPQLFEYKELYMGPGDPPQKQPTKSPRPTKFPTASPTPKPTISAAPSPKFGVEQLVLVNAETKVDMRALKTGEENALDIRVLSTFNIRAETAGPTGSVWFWVNDSLFRQENVAPYALAGDSGGNYESWNARDGVYEIRATPYSESNGRGVAGTSLTVVLRVFSSDANQSAPTSSAPTTPAPVTPEPATPAPVTLAPVTPAPITPAPVTPAPVTPAPVTLAPVSPAPTEMPTRLPTGATSTSGMGVTKIIVVNAETDEDMFDVATTGLTNLDLVALPPFTLRAGTMGSVGSVWFWVNDENVQKENFSPYVINGDTMGDVEEWVIDPGKFYEVTATAFSDSEGAGTEGSSVTVLISTFSSESQNPTPSPATPAPTTPAPVTPAPISPAPVATVKMTPSPITPAPVTPAPMAPTLGTGVTRFMLVNTETDRDMYALTDGVNVLDPDQLPPFSIRAETSGTVGSVWFWVNNERVRRENVAPFSIAGDKKGNYKTWKVDRGAYYEVKATAFSEKRGQGQEGSMIVRISTSDSVLEPIGGGVDKTPPSSPSSAVPVPGARIKKFVVVNAETNTDMFVLSNDQLNVLDISKLPPFNIRVTTTSKTASVSFFVNGNRVREDSKAPYSIGGGKKKTFKPWTIDPGDYDIIAIPYNRKGKAGEPLTIRVEVITSDQLAGEPFAPTASPAVTDIFDMNSLPEDQIAPSVDQLVLVNTETNEDELVLNTDESGNVLTRNQLPREGFTIRAETSGSPGSVWFFIDGRPVRNENRAPYSIAGRTGGNFDAWRAGKGIYEITATPYSQRNGKGTEGVSLTIIITVL